MTSGGFSVEMMLEVTSKACVSSCSPDLHSSEEGSYLRLIDFVYHSTLGLRVIKKKKKITSGCRSRTSVHDISKEQLLHRNAKRFRKGLVFKAHRWFYHSTLGSRVMNKKEREYGQGNSRV